MNGSERAAGATRAGVTETVVRLPHGLVLPAGVEEVVVRRSTRRRRSVAARRDGRRIIVMVPARMSRAEELMARAAGLRRTYVPEAPEPASVRWVSNQRSRWGSCTSAERTIRLSDRLRAMPDWVIDAVLVHELAHLVHCDHGPAFRRIERRYELAEKASGFLEGWEAGAAFVGQGG